MALGVVLRLLILVTVLFAFINCTIVRNCKGRSYGKRLAVDINNCPTLPCILKKNTTASIVIRFIPGGVPLPFIGVDGTSACGHLYMKDGSTKAGCPLKANTEYVYKNQFDVLPVYPTVNPLVHWALQDSANNQDVICLQVPSQIEQ